MRLLILALTILAMNSCASRTPKEATYSQPEECLGDNSKPQFGYDAHHVFNSCDQAFINEIDKKTSGRRGEAVRKIREDGYEMIEKDPVTPIKRFNQAWLLDRNDPETYRAFSDWEMKMGNTKRADEFRDRARMLEKL